MATPIDSVGGKPPIFQIVIQWSPSGEIRIGWPQVDDVIKLGMIEFAKSLLIEERAKQSQSNIVLPKTQIV